MGKRMTITKGSRVARLLADALYYAAEDLTYRANEARDFDGNDIPDVRRKVASMERLAARLMDKES